MSHLRMKSCFGDLTLWTVLPSLHSNLGPIYFIICWCNHAWLRSVTSVWNENLSAEIKSHPALYLQSISIWGLSWLMWLHPGKHQSPFPGSLFADGCGNDYNCPHLEMTKQIIWRNNHWWTPRWWWWYSFSWTQYRCIRSGAVDGRS